MNVHFTELIISQTKTLLVMLAAGIFVESFMQIKKLFQQRCGSIVLRIAAEAAFWVIAAASVSAFLYYCAFGKISIHALAGFLAGVLLWKKICCGIIGTWVKTDEAKNLKTTAKLSTWRKRDVSGWKKDVLKEKRKKKKKNTRHGRIQEERWQSEEVAIEDD